MSTLKANIQIQPQELFTSSATARTDLGAVATTGDGRYFRYVLAGGTTLAQGKVQSAAAETTGWEDLDIAAALIGATQLVTTSTITATLNQLAGGLLTVTNGTGSGYTYKIKGNTAASGAVATIYLEDALQTALASSVDIDFVLNPYNGVILAVGASLSATPVGVAVYPVVNAQYGWIQTSGPCSVLADASGPTVGANVFLSDDTDGAVGLYETDATANGIIGYAMTGITSAEYGFVMLNLP